MGKPTNAHTKNIVCLGFLLHVMVLYQYLDILVALVTNVRKHGDLRGRRVPVLHGPRGAQRGLRPRDARPVFHVVIQARNAYIKGNVDKKKTVMNGCLVLIT